MGTLVNTQHPDFDDVEGEGAIGIVHDQDITIAETRLSLDVGLTARYGASLVLPVRVVSTRIRYLHGSSGSEVNLVQASPHHRNETLTGLADPMLLGVARALGVTGRFGVTIPIGGTESDPFLMPEQSHQHIQMGTGTFMPVAALEKAYPFGKWKLAGFAFGQLSLYENSKGYKPGHRYAAGLALRRSLGKVSVRGGLEIQGETRERWNAVSYTDEGNQGRVDFMSAFGATWSITDDFSLDLGLKIPIINHVVGGQLDMPALLEIGAAYSFGKRTKPVETEEDHDHEHGDGHDHEGHADGHDEHGHDEHGHDEHAAVDTAGADVVDLVKDGSRVDLTPVPGKVTIFDFWATWCEPCKTLEPALAALAKANPSGVALRRIDVVDWESAVVAQHLTPRGFGLPHVKVYSATGELLLEQSSAPGALQSMINSIRVLAGDKTVTETTTNITVTEKGFEPANITVPRGAPVTLRFHRKVKRSCATEVIMEVDGKPIRKDLPLDEPVELTVTFPTPGTISYACAMNMIGGTITVR